MIARDVMRPLISPGGGTISLDALIQLFMVKQPRPRGAATMP